MSCLYWTRVEHGDQFARAGSLGSVNPWQAALVMRPVLGRPRFDIPFSRRRDMVKRS